LGPPAARPGPPPAGAAVSGALGPPALSSGEDGAPPRGAEPPPSELEPAAAAPGVAARGYTISAGGGWRHAPPLAATAAASAIGRRVERFTCPRGRWRSR